MTHAPATAKAPPAILAAWAVLAAGAAGLVYWLAQLWSLEPDNADRGLILAAAAWAAYMLAPGLAGLGQRPLKLIGLGFLVPAAMAYLPVWAVYPQVGPRPAVLWWTALCLVAATAGLILLRHGPPTLRTLRFPLLFPLLALPLPVRVLNVVQPFLQEATTTLADYGLRMCGMTVIRDGYVLALPSGQLGVVEACSGVRSVTALVAVGVFLAYLKGFKPARGSALLGLTLPVIVLVNGLRVVLTGFIQEFLGREHIEGWKHEALGFGTVLIGLWVLTVFAKWLDPGQPAADAAPIEAAPVPPSGGSAWAAAGVLAAAAVASAYLSVASGLGKPPVNPFPHDAIPLTLGRWQGEESPIDPQVSSVLYADSILHRVYSRLGYDAHAWAIHWNAANGNPDYHHPDVCWGNRGFAPTLKRDDELTTPAGRKVPIVYREFARGSERQMVVYWKQKGRRPWTAVDEADAHDPLYVLNYAARRVRPGAVAVGEDRLVVLVGVQTWSGAGFGTADVYEFTGRLADATYDACPWADPARTTDTAPATHIGN